MTSEVESIYRKMIDDYPRRIVAFRQRLPFERETIRIMQDEIQASDLRSDAKVFLLLNMHIMIVIPLLQELPPSISPSQLRETVILDIRDIIADVDRASSKTTRPQPEGASAHAVMQSVDKLWSDLRINQLKVWGRDDD